MTRLSSIARKNQLLGDLVRANNAIPAGQRKFFYANKPDAIKNLPNQEIVLLDDYMENYERW